MLKKKVQKLEEEGAEEPKITDFKKQREAAKSQRDYWFDKHINYMHKINDLSLSDTPLLIEKAEDYCTNKSDWVLKESDSKWVECFKKCSEKDPFMSDKLLKTIHSKGGIRSLLKYLEFLTLKCKVEDQRLHTKYVVNLIQLINSILDKKFLVPEQEGVYD